MKASLAIQILPDTVVDSEVIRVVDEVIAYIQSTGLNCVVGPFETTIEGESIDQIMDIAKQCVKMSVESGVPGVAAYMKVFYRLGGDLFTIEQKTSKYTK